jgi:hypothetical protein
MTTLQGSIVSAALALAISCQGRPPSPNVRPLPGPEPPAWGTPAWRLFLTHFTDSLESVDPFEAADTAAARGDFHLLGITAYSLEVPGLPPLWSSFDYPILTFPAGSDAIEGKEHSRYMGVTYAFAADYNSVILSHLGRTASEITRPRSRLRPRSVAGCFNLGWRAPAHAVQTRPLPTVLVLALTPHRLSSPHVDTWQFGDAHLLDHSDSVVALGEWNDNGDLVSTTLWSASGLLHLTFGVLGDSISGRATVEEWGLSEGNVMRTGRVYGSRGTCPSPSR